MRSCHRDIESIWPSEREVGIGILDDGYLLQLKPGRRLLGANSAVLLTEFAGVFAPNIEDDFFIDIG